MSNLTRRALVAGVVGVVAVGPFVFYRSVYAHGKRLRPIIPGKVYRSGQLTAAGFQDAVRQHGIRTIVNVQDDYPDPDINHTFWDRRTVKESELCRRLGVRYVFLAPDLVPRRDVPERRPAAIDELLSLLDEESNLPVLIHCKAGLHRTGVLSAVVRMEYQGWSRAEAYRELKGYGFGDWACTAANDYVYEYVLTYRRGLRLNGPAPAATD
jgi:tyrosine-protein phosphatase SIW14